MLAPRRFSASLPPTLTMLQYPALLVSLPLLHDALPAYLRTGVFCSRTRAYSSSMLAFCSLADCLDTIIRLLLSHSHPLTTQCHTTPHQIIFQPPNPAAARLHPAADWELL